MDACIPWTTKHLFLVDLFDEASVTAQRIQQLSERTAALEEYLPHVEDIYERTAPGVFYRTNVETSWRREDKITFNIFSSDNRPQPIEKVRESAYPPPMVSLLDDISGRSCLKIYSDPDFFLRQWLEEDARISASRTQGKKKTKKRRKQRRANQQEIQTMDVKVFSGYGKEFGGATVVSLQATTVPTATDASALLTSQLLEAQQQHEQNVRAAQSNTTPTPSPSSASSSSSFSSSSNSSSSSSSGPNGYSDHVSTGSASSSFAPPPPPGRPGRKSVLGNRPPPSALAASREGGFSAYESFDDHRQSHGGSVSAPALSASPTNSHNDLETLAEAHAALGSVCPPGGVSDGSLDHIYKQQASLLPPPPFASSSIPPPPGLGSSLPPPPGFGAPASIPPPPGLGSSLPPPPGTSTSSLPPPPGMASSALPPPPGMAGGLPPPPGAGGLSLPPPPGAGGLSLPPPPGSSGLTGTSPSAGGGSRSSSGSSSGGSSGGGDGRGDLLAAIRSGSTSLSLYPNRLAILLFCCSLPVIILSAMFSLHIPPLRTHDKQSSLFILVFQHVSLLFSYPYFFL